jgi:hypothetical protein
MNTTASFSCLFVLSFYVSVIAAFVYAAHGLKRTGQPLQWLWCFVCPILGIIPVYLAYEGLKRLWEAEAQSQRLRLAEQEARRERLKQQEEERKREEADRPRRLAAAEEARQRAQAARISALASECREMAKKIAPLIQDAERELDLAEHEFDEGVLDPFWDAIERAVTKLATVESHIEGLIRKGENYRAEAAKASNPPPLDLGLATVPDARGTEMRMRGIIRRSQKSADFTQIFHLRKVTKVLVAGFSTLGHAINDLGSRLELSQERLLSVFSISMSELVENQQAGTSAIVHELKHHRKDPSAADRELKRQLQSEAKTTQKMLDNIQRRKKPFPRLGDGQY